MPAPALSRLSPNPCPLSPVVVLCKLHPGIAGVSPALPAFANAWPRLESTRICLVDLSLFGCTVNGALLPDRTGEEAAAGVRPVKNFGGVHLVAAQPGALRRTARYWPRLATF